MNGQLLRRATTARAMLGGACLLGTLGAAGITLVWAAEAPVAAVRTGPASFDNLLTVTAATACALLLGWLSVATLLAMACAVTGQATGAMARLAGRLTPVIVRRAVGLTLGVTMSGGLAIPAGAAAPLGLPAATASAISSSSAERSDTPDPVSRPERPPLTALLPGGWTPDRPAASTRLMSEPPARHLHRARTRVDVPVVEVRPGDTLWGIAADLLGPTASDRDIAHEWPQWYRENRAVVGPDPDRLVPGQHLHPPELP